jgi:hypothetical protein
MEQVAIALALLGCFVSSFTAAMVWGYFLEALDSGDDV